MDADERTLVADYVSRRDEASFHRLYERCSPRLYMLALRLAGGRVADAEDILQEAWIRACQGIASFRGDSKLQTWLSGILINCWRERLRAAGIELPLDQASDEPVSVPADGALESLVNALPARCREVLILHDLEGYTHEEIGRALNIAPGTSKHQLFRARQLLRGWLGDARGVTHV